MAKLDPELSTTILLGMRERQAGKILGLLPPEKAADLTGRIARARTDASEAAGRPDVRAAGRQGAEAPALEAGTQKNTEAKR
jgi:flagellar motility protein MotE (MotC chaperone)